MAGKISHELKLLAAKTKRVEGNISAASQKSGENLDKMIADSKKDLKAKKEIFVNHAEEINAKLTGEWSSFKNALKQKLEHVKEETEAKTKHTKERIVERKYDWDAAMSEQYYNDSIDYSLSCIKWASVALAEVESSILEAYSAKLKLDAFKNQNIITE